MSPPVKKQPPIVGGPSRWAVPAAAFASMAFVQGFLHWRSALHDTDSYVHLAFAKLYAEEGLVRSVDALRFSMLGDGFGDKE